MSDLKNSNYRSQYYIGELYTAAYMVSRGVKPVYSISFPAAYKQDLMVPLELCLDNYNLYYTDSLHYIENISYMEINLFKYPYLERILRFVKKIRCHESEIFKNHKDFS